MEATTAPTTWQDLPDARWADALPAGWDPADDWDAYADTTPQLQPANRRQAGAAAYDLQLDDELGWDSSTDEVLPSTAGGWRRLEDNWLDDAEAGAVARWLAGGQ